MPLPVFTPSASTTSAASTSPVPVSVGGSGHFMRIVNAGPGNIFVLFYEPGTTPPAMNYANSMLILAGAIEIFSVASDTTILYLLGDPTGATANVTRGEGA